MIYVFKGFVPVIHESAFVHPLAAVTGNVIIGKDVYVGPFAALRGDWGRIIIGDGCNIQESCTIHMFPGITVKLDENVHVGHGAIIHGAHIQHDCLIGMNSVIMDNVVVGPESIIGAMTFIPEGTTFDSRSLIVGNPARLLKQVSDEMLSWKKQGTELYQTLPADMHQFWKECEALRTVPTDRPEQAKLYENWAKITSKKQRRED